MTEMFNEHIVERRFVYMSIKITYRTLQMPISLHNFRYKIIIIFLIFVEIWIYTSWIEIVFQSRYTFHSTFAKY